MRLALSRLLLARWCAVAAVAQDDTRRWEAVRCKCVEGCVDTAEAEAVTGAGVLGVDGLIAVA